MTGAEVRIIRKRLELERKEFALLLGYLGNTRNNETQMKRLEEEAQVRLTLGRFIWMIQLYVHEHNGNLPRWPKHLHIEGEEDEWK